MRLLLDTHAFLWWVADHPSLSEAARSAIADPDNECMMSIASAWEMAIKASLGKLELGMSVERFVPEQLAVNRFQQLPVALNHVLRAVGLPWHHRDPFDRLLVAQCQAVDARQCRRSSAKLRTAGALVSAGGVDAAAWVNCPPPQPFQRNGNASCFKKPSGT